MLRSDQILIVRCKPMTFKSEEVKTKKCPVCGGDLRPSGQNATSRYADVEICSQCGTNEAFQGPSKFVKMKIKMGGK